MTVRGPEHSIAPPSPETSDVAAPESVQRASTTEPAEEWMRPPPNCTSPWVSTQSEAEKPVLTPPHSMSPPYPTLPPAALGPSVRPETVSVPKDTLNRRSVVEPATVRRSSCGPRIVTS